ncbi:hypothetical protein GOV08_00680 [Candidatus Woesearchaeota archaeon]|nr:hypothetical protein [Candidatus Woesearchaeota archaeon]
MGQKQVFITGNPDVQEMSDLVINYANRERRDLEAQILDDLLPEDLRQTDAGLIYFLNNKFEVNNPPESYIWYPHPSAEFDLFKELENKGHKGERILLYSDGYIMEKFKRHATEKFYPSPSFLIWDLLNLIKSHHR